MSLLIGCKNAHGIVMAADSKAIDFHLDREPLERSITRLHQLTPTSVIMAGGAAEGEEMCLALKEFLNGEKLTDIDEVFAAALPFLASEYERFMRTKCEFIPLDPTHQIHFLLGGYSAKNTRFPFRLFLLWAKKKLPQIDGDEIQSAFTVPRIMRLEYQLAKLCGENHPLDQVLDAAQKAMAEQAQIMDEIGPPFISATITAEGVTTFG